MNKKIKDILDKANSVYSEGGFYTLNSDEITDLKDILNIDISNPELIDEIYDMIYNTAKQKWPTDQYFKQLQAENSGYGKEIIHTEPMGSMEELKEGDWDKWKVNHHDYLLTEKLDGCSIILTYQNGKLYSAATRGRGIKGKDIMRHIPFISNIPQEISQLDEHYIVRGELLCPKDEISTMLEEVAAVEGKEQKNGRNAIAGALNRKETNKLIFKHAHFVAYWDSINRGNALDELDEYGFETPWDLTIDNTTTEEELIEQVKEFLFISKYEIDGIILTQIDNPEEGFVSGTINPKASRKFKIGIYDNVAESVVKGITWQISKNCKLTPVLNIEPIELCGSTISNVTGHNYQNLINKKCGIGSKVKIKRAGLVIPYLEEVLTESSNINKPDNCYIKGVDLYLDNADNEVYIQKLVYFGKKLDIDQLGYGNCKAIFEATLADNQLLDSPELLYFIPEGYISKLIGKNGEKIEQSLKEKKNTFTECQFAAACGAFGPGIGERLLQPVYNKYNTLNVTGDQLEGVEGFEEKRITQYIEYLSNWILVKARAEKMDLSFVVNQKNKALPLSDKVICFTGIRDKDFAKQLEELGATIADSFTKKVNILITKDIDSTSSKIQKAKESGCQILSIDKAKEIFK